ALRYIGIQRVLAIAHCRVQCSQGFRNIEVILHGGRKCWGHRCCSDVLIEYLGGARLERFDPFQSSLRLLECRRMVVQLRTIVRLRSEEHTSELQSRFDLVCRLLLEKK